MVVAPVRACKRADLPAFGAGKNGGRFALMFDVEWVVLTGWGAHGIVPLESAYLSTKAVA